MKPSIFVLKLTIFYVGTVNVFDDITSEKVFSVMFCYIMNKII